MKLWRHEVGVEKLENIVETIKENSSITPTKYFLSRFLKLLILQCTKIIKERKTQTIR
jgi:hypothetical protein